MEWTKGWTPVKGIELKDTIYEKKYFYQGGIARITMAHAKKGLNMMTRNGILELIACLRDARLDDSIGVVIITGSGEKSFCVGGDIEEEKEGGSLQVFEETPSIHQHLRLLGKPVIAVVKGYCIGMGNHLAYHCDLTIAADNAVFGQVGPRVGSPAGGAIVTYLARVIGHKKAREMWMLCRRYTAQEALQMGLINAVYPLDKVDEEAEKWCLELLEMNPTCLKIIKASFDSDIENIPHTEPYFPSLIAPNFFGGKEQIEAMNAFLEKRKPDWGKIVRKRPEDFKA